MRTRSDYEIWLKKLLEGEAGSHPEEELHAFLSGDPDPEKTGGLKLQNEDHKFRNKSSLRRSSRDLPDDQFDYLCTAMVEKDLSPEGEKELLDIISEDKERQRTFEIFSKTRLIPGKYGYNGKFLLKRKTALQRFLLPAISSAAGIALLVAVLIRGNNEHVADGGGVNDIKDNFQYRSGIPGAQNNLAARNSPVINISPRENDADDRNGVTPKAKPDQVLQERVSYPALGRHFVPAVAGVFIEGIPDPGTDLVAIQTRTELLAVYDERPRVEKFLTRAYRELLLGEKGDRPLNRYELAKGGVNGLNRILGWEMAVKPDGNDDGVIESFQFSSKILNFSVPLKNNDDSR